MTENTITITPSRYAAALDTARLAVCRSARLRREEDFALTGDGKLLYHEKEIPVDVLWVIPIEHRRALLENIIVAAEMEIENLDDAGEDAA